MYIRGNNYGLIQLLINRISRECVIVAGVLPKVRTWRLLNVAVVSVWLVIWRRLSCWQLGGGQCRCGVRE